MKRVILVVLDGCGAGAAPDHAAYKDGPEAATLKNVWKAVGGFHTPTLAKVGFLAACRIAPNIDPEPGARYGRLRELSQGKDSVTGHWEMMGIITDPGFPTYPDGFPLDLVKEFEKRIGLQVLGNRPASGTKILDELGEQHVETRCPILYTSADSVFQIACHEEIYPIEELYGFCEVARELLVAPHNVSRVIARPFVGSPGKWVRTERRKDYPLAPPRNWTDEIGDIFGIGVVPELFAGRGFRQVNRTQSNREHAEVLFQALETDARFIFANFEDFDMLYGHRSDPQGFAKCLEEFDLVLAKLIDSLRADDLLILTADHGNDPTDDSTDHTREYVPVALVNHGTKGGNLGDVDGFSSVGTTVATWLGLESPPVSLHRGTNLL